jgi:hypothetical protein
MFKTFVLIKLGAYGSLACSRDFTLRRFVLFRPVKQLFGGSDFHDNKELGMAVSDWL